MSINNGSKIFTGDLRVLVEVKRSVIDGKGLFAKERISTRQKIGELGGGIINRREARRYSKGKRRIAIVELDNGKAIDASRWGNELKFINHSCLPNAFMRIFHNRVEFYALREIQFGEEVTCNYGQTHHDNAHRCKCKSSKCRGFI